MRINRERLAEALWDLLIEDRDKVEPSLDDDTLVRAYTERIMRDINAGIIQAERPGS